MKNKKGFEKLIEVAVKDPSNWIERSKQIIDNRDWIIKSSKIAVRILQEIDSQKLTSDISQKMLADKMGVSPQYISKILKGQENLSLETVCKIENALGITLIEIPNYGVKQKFSWPPNKELFGLSKIQVKASIERKGQYFESDVYYPTEEKAKAA